MTRILRRTGTVSVSFLFVVLSLFVLIATLWNAASVVHAKLDAQNTADAAAQAGGVQLARGMNQLTACNHAIGEANATCVLAHTPGGPELEAAVDGRGAEFDLANGIQPDFDEAFQATALAGSPADEAVYRKLAATTSDSGAAIGAARRQLKIGMTRSYRDQAAATRSGGDTSAALRMQAAIVAEWDILDRLETTAREKLIPLKRWCERTLIPELAAQATRVVNESPRRADAVAAELATRYGASGSLTSTGTQAGPLELPVVAESPSGGWERSQMVRATTPWVQFHREPVLAFAEKQLPLSGYAKHYREWSNRYTLEFSQSWKESRGVALYVLRDSDPTGASKGRERWAVAGGYRRAGELFGVIGVARRPSRPVLAIPLFHRSSPDGPTAFAQALLYNGNPQTPERNEPGDPATDWQPVVGWDTLNWNPEVRVPEFSRGLRDSKVSRPSVRLNWRVLLVPATHVGNAGLPGLPDNGANAQWPTRTH